MIIDYSRDGEICDIQNLKNKGFEIDIDKDIIRCSFDDTGSYIENYYQYNFVGFLVNESNDIHIVTPKGYKVDKINEDAKIIFTAIQKHKQKKPNRYIGNQYGDKYISNFPFAAFWGIYDYYQKYGLYYEAIEKFQSNTLGKINWKKTIEKTNYYVVGNNITIFPFFYTKKINLNTLITDCMIFAINYTSRKFNNFLDISDTGKDIDEYDFFHNKNKIIEILKQAKTMTFKDISTRLLDDLINFYENLNEGGIFYLKTYIFEYVWEDIVLDYLRHFFTGIKENKLIFDKNNSKMLDFKKSSFHPNLANKNHKIEPDYYCINKDIQYIFDAKYKKNIRGIDYKQVCYSFFLKDMRNEENSNPLYNETYSALLIPQEETYSKIHFKIDPLYNNQINDIVIIEQYLDIKKVLMWYVNQ